MKKLTGINKFKFVIQFSDFSLDLRRLFVILLLGLFLFFVSFSLKINPIIVLLLLSIVLYIDFIYRKNLFCKPQNLLYLILIFVLIFVSSFFLISRGYSIYFIPFSIAPMLITLLFNDLITSLIITISLSLSVSLMSANNVLIGILFLISGLVSSVLVFDARTRNTVIRGGIITGIIQAFSLLFMDNFIISNHQGYLLLVANGFLCSVVVLGSTPVFEYLFNTITNISLLELADFHHPLLNRMIMEAPGTYHHSLIVGNISELACEAVGANTLLARVGAYYHDIGKLEKPEYFSENQAIKVSKHESLPANMSKLIIINHVKEGFELAKAHRLNPRIIDFIQQHHGTGLVYYFYRRALEALEEDQEVKEEGFRYPGPKPNTKETAIVLLADSVEAATRAMKEPNVPKIEEIVHKIINNKFIDGQLDECDLTLKDLEKISNVFIRILTGIYHTRINYPDEKLLRDHKKTAKEFDLGPNQEQGAS